MFSIIDRLKNGLTVLLNKEQIHKKKLEIALLLLTCLSFVVFSIALGMQIHQKTFLRNYPQQQEKLRLEITAGKEATAKIMEDIQEEKNYIKQINEKQVALEEKVLVYSEYEMEYDFKGSLDRHIQELEEQNKTLVENSKELLRSFYKNYDLSSYQVQTDVSGLSKLRRSLIDGTLGQTGLVGNLISEAVNNTLDDYEQGSEIKESLMSGASGATDVVTDEIVAKLLPEDVNLVLETTSTLSSAVNAIKNPDVSSTILNALAKKIENSGKDIAIFLGTSEPDVEQYRKCVSDFASLQSAVNDYNYFSTGEQNFSLDDWSTCGIRLEALYSNYVADKEYINFLGEIGMGNVEDPAAIKTE